MLNALHFIKPEHLDKNGPETAEAFWIFDIAAFAEGGPTTSYLRSYP